MERWECRGGGREGKEGRRELEGSSDLRQTHLDEDTLFILWWLNRNQLPQVLHNSLSKTGHNLSFYYSQSHSHHK